MNRSLTSLRHAKPVKFLRIDTDLDGLQSIGHVPSRLRCNEAQQRKWSAAHLMACFDIAIRNYPKQAMVLRVNQANAYVQMVTAQEISYDGERD